MKNGLEHGKAMKILNNGDVILCVFNEDQLVEEKRITF